MHSSLNFAAALAVLAGLQDCGELRIVHPLSDATDRVTEPALAGRWLAHASEEATFYLTFYTDPTGAASYHWHSGIIHQGTDHPEEGGEATLVRADGFLFLETAPRTSEADHSNWLRLRTVYVVDLGDSLKLGTLRPDSIIAPDGELDGLAPLEANDMLILGGPAIAVLDALTRWAKRPGWTDFEAVFERDTTWTEP